MPHPLGCDSCYPGQAVAKATAGFGVSGTLGRRNSQGDWTQEADHRGKAGRHHRDSSRTAERMDVGTVGRIGPKTGTRDVWHASAVLLAKRCAGWILRKDPQVAAASSARPRSLAAPGRQQTCRAKHRATSQTSFSLQTAGKPTKAGTLAGTTACGLGAASCTSSSTRSAEVASRPEKQQWPA